ncbi:MAG: type II secretion system minor pseudopilin GspJ [Maricaulaceae bacterium]
MSRAGFTLVEVVIALGVFGLIAAGAGTMLVGAIDARDRLGAAHQALAELDRARALLKADILQIAHRSGRDPAGAFETFALTGGDVVGQPLLAFTRRGWENPDGLERRSSLVRVRYGFEDGQLTRQVRLRPDAGDDTPVREQIVFDQLNAIELAFLDAQGWRPIWQAALTPGRLDLPRAIRVRIDHPELGEIEQMFLTSAGG